MLRLDDWTREDAVVVVPSGRLDVDTYGQLRDHLVKVGTDGPRAVVVDLTALDIDSGAALSIFPVVQTRLRQWPGVPLLLLVTGHGQARELVDRSHTGRHLSVHDSVPGAMAAIDDPPPRRVARLRLPNALTSPRAAREFTRNVLATWGLPELTEDALLLVGELVTNAVVHTSASPLLRLELRRDVFSIAVHDDEPGEVIVRDRGPGVGDIHGLLLVAQVASAWGCSPTLAGGKVVWATLRSPRRVSSPDGRARE